MVLVDTILESSLVRSIGDSVVRTALSHTRFAGAYWRVAPSVYRSQRHLAPNYIDLPIDPFKLVLVDPDRIVRFTGRQYPVWTGRWKHIGAVKKGDWDTREVPPINPSHTGQDPSLYLADTVTETPLHAGLKRHFVDGVPWNELAFIEELLQQVRTTDSSVWQYCSTVSEVRQYCRELDHVYRDMRDRGCLSMRELNVRDERLMTIREVMENEILVDIARDGELLFVTGRHRLSMARILGFDRIPVAIAVRHPKWLERHERTRRGARRRNGIPPDYESVVGEPLNVAW